MVSEKDYLALGKRHAKARNIFRLNISFCVIVVLSSSSRNAIFSNSNSKTLFLGLKSVTY